MNVEDVLFFLTKINDGFEGESTVKMPVIKEGEAHVDIRINDDLYHISITKDYFKNK